MSVMNFPGVDSMRTRVAAEVRAEMGRQRWTGRKLATALAVNPGWMARRLSGEVALDVEDLERIGSLLDVSPAEFLARADNGPRPVNPDEGQMLPRLDSNQQPAGYRLLQVTALSDAA